jgi:hypothetical protein
MALRVSIHQLVLDHLQALEKLIVGEESVFDLSVFLLGEVSQQVTYYELLIVRLLFHTFIAPDPLYMTGKMIEFVPAG